MNGKQSFWCLCLLERVSVCVCEWRVSGWVSEWLSYSFIHSVSQLVLQLAHTHLSLFLADIAKSRMCTKKSNLVSGIMALSLIQNKNKTSLMFLIHRVNGRKSSKCALSLSLAPPSLPSLYFCPYPKRNGFNSIVTKKHGVYRDLAKMAGFRIISSVSN